MNISQISTTSYMQIIKEVFDNPANIEIAKKLQESGFKKEVLINYTLNDNLNSEEVDYIRKFLQTCSLHLQLS